ncbi:MAG: NADH-quinone oxidoreductase subunit C [Methanospirillum sp.]|nr:NADH-quinone oxidoreductase subunit C [Methanospirillum sp.]
MRREEQPIEVIEIGSLVDRAAQKKVEGNRLVAISCAAVEGKYEVTYSFEERDHRFTNLRVVVEPGGTVPSVTPVYWGAFVYENEIHDLFGLDVTGINVDYGGHFFDTKVKHPFALTPATRPPEKTEET